MISFKKKIAKGTPHSRRRSAVRTAVSQPCVVPARRDHMAGRAVAHVTWVDLVNSTHLATAFSYDSLDQIIGTCMLLLYSLPASDKPSSINPVALEWATAVDRYRYEVRQPTQVRKDHQQGKPIRPTAPPGLDALIRPSALRSRSQFSKMKRYLPWAVRSHPCGAALGGISPDWGRCAHPTNQAFSRGPMHPGTRWAGHAL